jgi:hypothetical protein
LNLIVKNINLESGRGLPKSRNHAAAADHEDEINGCKEL